MNIIKAENTLGRDVFVNKVAIASVTYDPDYWFGAEGDTGAFRVTFLGGSTDWIDRNPFNTDDTVAKRRAAAAHLPTEGE